MKHYLNLSRKYLAVHKRETRLIVISVLMAVTLVSGIFSMLDTLVKFEKTQILEREGNYHILVRNPSKQETAKIGSQMDVKKSGSLKSFVNGIINGTKCAFATIDADFAPNMNVDLAAGKYPKAPNEVMVENWYADKKNPVLKPGDSVLLTLPDGKEGTFTISGIFKDWGATKAAGIPGIFLSPELSERFAPESDQYFILFKDGTDIRRAETQIQKSLGIKDDRIGRNEGLLALMGQSKNNRALQFYLIGAILFFLVLVTAVVMIYNTFNISVTDRVRQFGILRCIGASAAQVRRLVRREGLFIALRAIPAGVAAGMLMSIVCSAVLKYFNSKVYGGIPLVNFSAIGISAGVIVGFLTVAISSLLPARKAARVSPVEALRGGSYEQTGKRSRRGLLMKLFHAETAMGIGSAVRKKKTLLLMSGSIGLSIIIFLGFTTLADPAVMGMNPTQIYTADLSLSSEQTIDQNILNQVSNLKGVKRVFGRMSAEAAITFRASGLTDKYKKVINARADSNGMIVNPGKSWLVSYDQTQIQWAKNDLTAGEFNESRLNEQNGIIAVEKNSRNGVLYKAVRLKPGDKVRIRTKAGEKVFTVQGVVEKIPYGTTDNPVLAQFITTEKLFTEITGVSGYNTVDIQLHRRDQEQTAGEIKAIAGHSVTIGDRRQYNSEANNNYMTVVLFIYGFVGVIALISILNIINTMNTSIAAKTRYLGLMRAIGMSGSQLSVMVLAEALIYCLCGCLSGCIAGVALHRALCLFLFGHWTFPVLQFVMIFVVCILTAVLSVISPLKRIRSRGITEVISSL